MRESHHEKLPIAGLSVPSQGELGRLGQISKLFEVRGEWKHAERPVIEKNKKVHNVFPSDVY